MFTLIDILSERETRKMVRRAAREAEDAGFHAIRLQTHNGLSDPWTVASIVMSRTRRLIPLVAVNPIYTHPYSPLRKGLR